MDVTDSKQEYHCPGELQPISMSLHLARLAAGYSACENCDHRGATGTLPVKVIQKINTKLFSEKSPALQSLFKARTKIRGIYLNELTRSNIESIVERILSVHFQELSRSSTAQLELLSPRVFVAHDWRPSSPDLAVGVVTVLRRWGCDVTDLGLINRSCFDFAMSQFTADLGLFVTGGTETERFNGLDVLASDGIEWSNTGGLRKACDLMDKPTSRPSRRAGDFQSISVTEAYEASVGQQFPEIEPLKVSLACAEPLTLQILGGLLLKHGCEVHFQELNDAESNSKKQIESFRLEVRDAHVDIGILIRADGQSLSLFDERGKQLSTDTVLNLLNLSEPQQQEAVPRHFEDSVEQTPWQLEADQKRSKSNSNGRICLADATPHCDAINVIGRVLEKLSASSPPLSILSHSNKSNR